MSGSSDSPSGIRFAPAFEAASAYSASATAPRIRLDLAGNEGRGPGAAFLEASLREWGPLVKRYPHTDRLTAALAERCGVDPSRVLVSNGGDEAIDRACRVVLCPGRNAVVPSPTFEMIPRYVAAAGAELRAVSASPRAVEAQIEAAADDATAFVSIVSPNNPSGEVTDAAVIRRVARRHPAALVLADLAYVEFADDDPTAALLEEPNVVVIRTLSKAWGLAGLRVGYALGSADAIGRMRAAGGPYAVTGPSAAIAAAWLEAGSDEVEAFVEQVRTELWQLAVALTELGWQVTDSQANFVTVVDDDAPALAAALLEQGIRVRAWPADPERRRFVRITCPGDPSEFDLLREALHSGACRKNAR